MELYGNTRMISSGDNTLRVAGLRQGTQSINDVFQFTFTNLEGEVHDIAYAVPAGTIPPRLVRDLCELKKRNLWTTIYLKEVHGRLAIVTIKEPRLCQAELWALSKRHAKIKLN